ncbi:MAG: A/G-specific adenine glycosylase [Acidobacteriaceae bacterium]|nr:A/G-specific adenine glycosylase [Acidobacteriaceae bacterium]MBV9781633.1 A/G-specific adenine glycosylase [Acidobacteriaceae bacterium]
MIRELLLSHREIDHFRGELLGWFARHARDLPWRHTRDPYHILVSEIMLQQTRVVTAIPYYERFLTRFPTLEKLADAPESEVLAEWAGLGYYHRARNLQKAMQFARDAGRFPDTMPEIRNLPGVGDYTAAAVASISFNLPEPALDGNVFRVLSRVFDDETNIASHTAREHFSALARDVLDRDQPGTFNQAMMELGATVCLPKSPHCLICPVAGLCRARLHGCENVRPVKTKPRSSVEQRRVLLWVERNGSILVWQRPETSRLMAGFWELPEPAQLPSAARGRKMGRFRHTITFHRYLFEVIETTCVDGSSDMGGCKWMALSDLENLPVSTILRKARRIVEKTKSKHRAAFCS